MEFLQVPLFDDDIYKLIVRFFFNLVFVVLLVWLVYTRQHKVRNHAFTLLSMNVMVFFICFTLKKLELELGMALGLFAIFSILRYRTGTMKVHDMTYLFVVVGIAVVNSLSNKKTSYVELVFANLAIVATCFVLELIFSVGKLKTCVIQTDRMDLIASDRASDLTQHIREKTGLNVVNVQVEKVDLNSGKVTLSVLHNGTHAPSNKPS